MAYIKLEDVLDILIEYSDLKNKKLEKLEHSKSKGVCIHNELVDILNEKVYVESGDYGISQEELVELTNHLKIFSDIWKDEKHCDINHIKSLYDELYEINKYDLDQIIFTENGKKVDIDPDILKQYKFTGLDNITFIVSEFYKGNFEEE